MIFSFFLKFTHLFAVINPMAKHTMCLYAVALAVVLPLCGCGEPGRGEDVREASAVSSGQVYPVGSYERRAADCAGSGLDITGREFTDFGSDSVFGGIEVESDENGEIVCTASDGALRFRITDGRFGSCGAFSAFVKKHAGAEANERLREYFRQTDGALFFWAGGDGRGIRSSRRYYFSHPPRLTVQVLHTDECRRKYGTAVSEVDFVRKNGSWYLDGLTLYRA